MTWKGTCWPGASSNGRLSPLTLKPAPVGLMLDIVILVDPVLTKVADKLLVVPTWTLLNQRVPGLQLNAPVLA